MWKEGIGLFNFGLDIGLEGGGGRYEREFWCVRGDVEA
jgi:hypothetical protein